VDELKKKIIELEHLEFHSLPEEQRRVNRLFDQLGLRRKKVKRAREESKAAASRCELIRQVLKKVEGGGSWSAIEEEGTC